MSASVQNHFPGSFRGLENGRQYSGSFSKGVAGIENKPIEHNKR